MFLWFFFQNTLVINCAVGQRVMHRSQQCLDQEVLRQTAMTPTFLLLAGMSSLFPRFTATVEIITSFPLLLPE